MKNQISRWVGCLGATLILAGAMAQEAVAEGDKDAKRESRRLQAQLSAVQKEKGILTTQLEALKKQLGDIESKGAALEKKTGGQRKQLVEMTEKYEESESNLQYMTQLYTESVEQLQQNQKEQASAQQRHDGDIHTCEKKNAELYRISSDLMDKYQSKGLVSVMLLAEPFTQIERVKMQSLMQEYKDKSDAAKLVPTEKPADIPASDATPSPVVASTSVEASTKSDVTTPSVDTTKAVANDAAVVPAVEGVAASAPDGAALAGSKDVQAAPHL
jgi:hypothetical protein